MPRITIVVVICMFLLSSAANAKAQSVEIDSVQVGNEGATDLSLVSRGGTRTYRCYRYSFGFSGPIGCTDFGVGDSPSAVLMEADFENDSDTEYVFYRPGATPTAQSNTWVFGGFPWMPQNITFGIGMDDPTVLGDYTGDGKADISVFRCDPADPVGTHCYFIYRSSEIGLSYWIPWGTVYAPGRADIAAPGDYDGDGKYDAAIRRPLDPNNPNGVQIFWIRRSSDGGHEARDFGLGTDKFISGDFDNDGKTDLCAVRNTQNEGTQLRWFIRYSSTGTWAWNVPFGLGKADEIGDYLAPGDYDGDGRLDITVWRREATNTRTIFYILPSTATPGVFGPVAYKQFEPCTPGPCLFPVTQYLVH